MCAWEKLSGTKKATSAGWSSIVGRPSKRNVCSYSLFSGKDGKVTVYICENNVCRAPLVGAEAAIAALG